MAGRVRDARLETPTARARLKASGKPYFKAIGEGLHLGYRKGKTDGKWVARVYRGSGGYATETLALADDRAEADGAAVLTFWQAQEAARALQAKMLRRASAGPYTVADAVRDYFLWRETEGRPTRYDQTRIAAHLPAKMAATPVDDLTRDALRRWLAGLATGAPKVRGAGGKPRERAARASDDAAADQRARRASANRIFTILRAALNHAFNEKRASSDAEWRAVKPFRNVEQARVAWLTLPEAQRLINACHEPGFRALVQAALQTGCRYSELARLRVRDFDPHAGTVSVAMSKTGKPRHVVLTDEGVALFRTLAAGRSGGDYLLRNLARMERAEAAGVADLGDWRASEQARPMAEACRIARIEPPVSFHGLRHTWASLAVMAGVPLIVVARNLGHADTRMVEKHYGHLAETFVTEAIRSRAPRFGLEASNVVGIGR